MRINVGCGQTPIEGWRNFDNSISVHLSKTYLLALFLFKLKLLGEEEYAFVNFCRLNRFEYGDARKIEYGDARKRLPLADGSIDVFYSSHMIEHLDQTDATKVLKEARRVLCHGGIIRLSVPDLHKLAEKYIETREADKFISRLKLSQTTTRTIIQKLKFITTENIKNHRWMYDGESLRGVLTSHGFLNASVMPAGTTRIKNHEPLNLYNRAAESVYVEAENP